jgi:hypothetical protein
VRQQRPDVGGDEGPHVGVDQEHEAGPEHPAPRVLGVLRAAAGAGVLEEHGDVRAQLRQQRWTLTAGAAGRWSAASCSCVWRAYDREVVVHGLRHAVEEVREAVRVLRDRADEAVGGHRVISRHKWHTHPPANRNLVP